MKLSDLQRDFCRCIRVDAATHELPVIGEGLRVYRHNYRAQLRSALKSGFPHLALWLGDFAFDRAADEHIGRSVPNSWTLDHYGHDFPETLRDLFPNDPEVEELAWLDWAMGEALVAKDERPLEAEALAGLDWDHARILFVSSLRISKSRSNAAGIWAALEERSPPPPPTLLKDGPALVVWRKGLRPCFRPALTGEFKLVSALQQGLGFAGACEILRRSLGEGRAIEAAGQLLSQWLHDELIVKIAAGDVAIARPCAN